MNFDGYQQTYVLTYRKFAQVVRSILKDAIANTEGIPRLQSTKARGKDVTSLKLKLESRMLLTSEHIENDIKDLAGVRLIFYTNSDIDRFLESGLIPDTFAVDWNETRVHHPTEDNDRQRYQAIHFTVSLGEKHTALSKYRKFEGMRCEIQIQTVLNHAWAETYHDMIYKAHGGQGFGTDAQQALDRRMKKIMDEYLLPAGYEFQKVQQDYERLMQGKALFDRGVFEMLERCDNNNDRHALLSAIAEHVIPNYDDIASVYQEIRRAVVTAVLVARNTEPKPLETPFGKLRGKTAKDVSLVAVNILTTLRYVNVEATFRTLTGMYQEEQDAEIRKQIVDAVRHLAKYNRDIWNQAGPYVQGVLADTIETYSEDERHSLRQVVLAVWHELLRSEMESSVLSADKLTLYSSALPVYHGLRALRNRAINGLLAILDGSTTEPEQREVVHVLDEATRLPGRAADSHQLHQLTLENTSKITEALNQRAVSLPYELLEHIEQDMLFDYRSVRQYIIPEHDESGCQLIAENVMEAIRTFRDTINADQQYVCYKTLVGFESVFSFQWENEADDFAAIDMYRTEQATLYIDQISDETAEDWYRLIQRCAATKSNDMATFPTFGMFLHQLSKSKPTFALALLQRDDAGILGFIHVILTGLSESEAEDEYRQLIEDYLGRRVHLMAIARHCHLIKRHGADTIKKVLVSAIATDEALAVAKCLIYGIEYHSEQELPLVEGVFVPAMRYLLSKKDARWIQGAWYLPQCKQFFYGLPAEYIELVLDNLLPLDSFGYEEESILTPIAMKRPALLWTFFERRIKSTKDRGEQYEAIPFQLHDLTQALAGDTHIAITEFQRWYRDEDPMLRSIGGRLLRGVFPTFTEELESSIMQLIAGGSAEEYDFVIHLQQNYCGEPATYEVMKELIDRLPENDPRLAEIENCLNSTGLVSGPFGLVAAYREKKEKIAQWQSDSRSKVKEFAVSYVRRMEQAIASEQRSAEMRMELRKLDYDDEAESE